MFLLLQKVFQERVVSRREAEFNKLKKEREDRIKQLLQTRKQERETRRKLIFHLRSEEERLNKLHEEEEARKHEGISSLFKSYIYLIWLLKCNFKGNLR